MEKVYQYIFSKIPNTVDFDFITVKNETVQTIYLDNISSQSILFQIESSSTNPGSSDSSSVEGSYKFIPSSGIIPRHKKMEIQIVTYPKLANVLVANARIILDQKFSKIIKLSSISKYPYLNISKPSLDFGVVQIGHSSEQELIIYNHQSVPAFFSIERTSVQPGKQPLVFFISDLTGEIPPNSNFLVKILYRPIFPASSSYETFTVITKGGNKVLFSCNGQCIPLRTWIGAKKINFKTIALGTKMKKLFRIYNDSDTPTEFKIFHDNDGAFSFDINQGVIPGKSNVRVNVTFRPYETISYYQRVFCLIRNHNLLAIDLFGSCHNLLTKSPIIDWKQIEVFRLKEMKGLFFNKTNNNFNFDDDKRKLEMFESLNSFNGINNNNTMNYAKTEANKENKEIILQSSGGGGNNNELSPVKDKNQIMQQEKQQQPQLHKEMFWETYSDTRLISFNTDLLDFGFIQSGTVSEPQILKVNNNSNEDFKVKFIFEKPINLNNLIKSINIFKADSTVFFTQPEEQIVPRFSSAEFKVYFKPNKSEFYFYSNLPCQATIVSLNSNNKNKSTQLNELNKSKLSEFGKGMVSLNNQSIEMNNSKLLTFNNVNKSTNKSISLFGSTLNNNQSKKKNLFLEANSTILNKKSNFQPPVTLPLSVVGHSFPPGTQIFIPMFEINPKKEIYFPPTSLSQSLFQSLKIENKNDTPLYYKLQPDPTGIFRVFPKYGLIPSSSFHLICLEFCPKDTTVYRFPLRITFNHDSQNIKTIMLNGLCTDPVIEIEGINNEMYFPPSYVGIKTKKTVSIKNISPINILVKIKIDNGNQNGILEVEQDEFEMGTNLIKNINFYLTPTKMEEIFCQVMITAERVYDPSSENIGIYNPEMEKNKTNDKKEENEFDKRLFTKSITVLGRGSDGELKIEPSKLEFGTVKVGFHKKLSFSIFNPTLTNFYIRVVPDYMGNPPLLEDKKTKSNKDPNKYRSDISFDFEEGLLNSFCKKEISMQFDPKTRANLDFKVNIFATDNNNINLSSNNRLDNSEKEILLNFIPKKEELKCSLEVTAMGDYPLIKIVDIRNNIISNSKLWKNFHVDEANAELQKKLTNEEVNFANSKSNKKNEDVTEKLKLIKFDFGKHFFKKNANMDSPQHFDVFLTLKNEGGVTSEFYFKFPGDVNIKREIWMDPVEPTSNDKVEYHVLKENIFTIEPRQSKLNPGECCNIRFRYNIKEKGNHRLRVIFQVVNGKPLIFELSSETVQEKKGVLQFPKKVIDFGMVPIGYTDFISSPIEIENLSSMKIKYSIDSSEIEKFNQIHKNFDVIRIDSCEGSVASGESKFITVYFRPLTETQYKHNFEINYSDDIYNGKEIITIQGQGYRKSESDGKDKNQEVNPFDGMANGFVYNYFKGERIQKCWVNIEELNFGRLDTIENKTFILYNDSTNDLLSFDFVEPGFLIKDQLSIQPNKGQIEPGEHKIIKCVLSPDNDNFSEYEGDITIKIIWNKKPKFNLIEGISGSNTLLDNIGGGNKKSFNFNNNNKKKLAKITGNLNTIGSSVINNSNNKNNNNMTSGNSTVFSTSKVNTIERENISLRLVKKTLLKKGLGNITLETNSNSSFVECLMKNLTRKIICSEDFEKNFSKNISMQPFSLYKFTSDEVVPSQKLVREKYLRKLLQRAHLLYGERMEKEKERMNRAGKRISLESKLMSSMSKTSNSNNEKRVGNIKGDGVDLSAVEEEGYDEENYYKIEEKYMKDLAQKYKYTVNEMNEKIICVNDETKKLIGDIMENTIYNTICEAVYGEIDLTVKPRIYFFLDKKNINIKIEDNNSANTKSEKDKISGSKNNNKESDMKISENEEKEENKEEKENIDIINEKTNENEENK